MIVHKLLIIYIIIDFHKVSLVVVKLTNVKCVEFDRQFATFEKCHLKLVKRGVVSLNIYVKLHQLPVANVSISAAIYKKFSGYRPFLYNTTTDFCQFMKNPKRFPPLKILYDIIAENTNINHTCPFDHDIIVNNLTLNEKMFEMIPLPPGDYMLKLMFGAYNDWKAYVQIYANFC